MRLKSSGTRREFLSEARESIRESLAGGYPVIGQTAQGLGLSTRTLQRRLHEAGVSYGKLVEKVRLDEARNLLQNNDLKVAAIASRLGYTDPSSFTRFFLRCTGTSPRAFRREHQR